MEKIRDGLTVKKERAILIGAILRGRDEGDDLTELVSLAESAGAIVVDRYQQKVHKINPSTYIGKGKVTELAERVKRFEADVIIFDNDLSPGQIRVIEEIVNVKVIDRSELILDIFATRAKTQQAKLQVEVAQLEYTYPRLTRMWSHLDALAGAGGATGAGAVGAIGTRGPGEQQLETDRRLVKDRVRDLKHELENIDSRRIREITGRQGLFKICLVGYTNTGKSTLLNKLTNADAYVEDKLFATLDTQTKKWTPVSGVEILLSDTVGFVRKLPHQLVASFKATLEEAVYADLLLHIIDASNPDAMKQIESVDKVLKEIGCGEKPALKVFNKVDAVKKISELETLQTLFPDALCISAKTGFGLEQLAEIAAAKYKGGKITVQVRISQSNGKAQSYLRACGTILKETYSGDSVIIEAVLGQNQLPGLKRLSPEKLKIID
ncbi:MAG: GTPase HflX [Planctomycetota bacterium]|nr:GTPase HflX [Planctomycetota bacterium]